MEQQNNTHNQAVGFDTGMQELLQANGQILCHWVIADDRLDWYGDVEKASLMLFEGTMPQSGERLKRLLRSDDLAVFVEEFSKIQDSHPTTPFTLEIGENSLKIRFLGADDDSVRFVMEGIVENDLHRDSLNHSLMTRPALCEAVEAMILGEDNEDAISAYILSIALDRISLLNEAYGASAVDQLMDDAVFRLRSLLPVESQLARISGDIYSVLLPDISNHHAESLAIQLIHDFVSKPFQTPHGPIRLTLSIGGLSLHGQCMRGGDALAKSEIALAGAKKMGGGSFKAYHEGLQNTIETRRLLKSGFDFLQAFDDGRLVMAFQPIIDGQDEQVHMYESLIRMIDEDQKMVPAGMFVPVLEELGFARMADRFVLRQVVEELEKYEDISLSVNVSNWSLTDPQWLRCIVALLQEKKSVARRLTVEITESVAMKNLKKAKQVIAALQALGCRVALDDFGAGHTSFKQIKDLGVDIVKIDKHFIRHIDRSENKLFIQALQSLIDGLGIETVAEGAESQRDVDMLKKMGVTYIQGYACGHPSTERLWLPKRHIERKIA